MLPESLEFGEVKVDATETISELEPVAIVAFTGDSISGDGVIAPALSVTQYSRVNGIPNAVGYVASYLSGLPLLIQCINLDGNGDKIVSVFTVPKLAVSSIMPQESPNVYPFVAISGIQMQAALTKTLSLTRPTSIDTYTPKNQKLLQYPFTYLGFNPQNGTKKVYRFEDFTGTPSFDFISEVNISPEVQVIPNNYRGSSGNSLSDNSTISGYPTLSYSNDVFNSWLAKNSEIISLNLQQAQADFMLDTTKQFMNPLGSMLGGGGSGSDTSNSQAMANFGSSAIQSGTGMISTAINYDFYIRNQVAQIEKQKLMPDQVSQGSSNATLMGYGMSGSQIFTRYTIKKQFAERIDKYFDMFGYLTNSVKLPNLSNRPNWNYVKTLGANIVADIPQLDLQAIKDMFDNGVTLWHNPATFLDYSQNNRTTT